VITEVTAGCETTNASASSGSVQPMPSATSTSCSRASNLAALDGIDGSKRNGVRAARPVVRSTGLAELGLRSALLVRLGVRDQTFGVLQLFDRRPDAFGREDEEVAEVLARHASIAVASAQQEASLWREADARKQVGQAQGILMERYGIDAQQAFGMLRQYSQENNTKLREIADQLTRDRRAPVSKQGGLSVPSWAESFVFGLTPWRIRCSSRPAQERNRSSLSVVCCWPQRCCRPWSPGCSSVGRCRPRPVPSRPGRRLSS
jgi:hypothetical protein